MLISPSDKVGFMRFLAEMKEGLVFDGRTLARKHRP
jgi:hypothetical protein